MATIEIEFNNALTLAFNCLETPIAKRWLAKLHEAVVRYDIDDCERFYGLSDDSEADALLRINNTVDVIAKHRPDLAARRLVSIHDIDTLNYLHHIFEVHHGLLDEQTDEFKAAPIEYQKALAQLNIDVHRCESVGRGGNKPRIVVTYFNQPKTEFFHEADFAHMTSRYEFGTIYVNYVEIGKTLEDLARDNDAYIGDDAFRPFNKFSADFNIKFWDYEPAKRDELLELMSNYYDAHEDFFASRGYGKHDQRLKSGNIPVAKLVTTMNQAEVIAGIKANNKITRVSIK